MANNTTVNVDANGWTLLTAADVAQLTFQNVSHNFVFIKATVGATPPASLAGAVRYNPGQGERNVLLTDLFPGVTGANRVYAWADSAASVMVSYA